MRIAIFYTLLITSILYAFLRGGAPEKWAAATYLVVGGIDQLVHIFTPPEFMEMDPGDLIVDTVIWIAFVAIALRANRFWPLCIASLQTIALVAHIAKLMDVSIHPQAYYIMQVASSYPLLIILAIGTYCHQRRLKENGVDPSWRSS